MISTPLNKRLFVYGTLRNDPQHAMFSVLARDAVFLGEGHVHGALYDLGSYPGMIVNDGACGVVLGEVYAIRDSAERTWETLDEYEGCSPLNAGPHEYDRQEVSVVMADGATITAWAYVLRQLPCTAVLLPEGDYLAWMRQRAQSAREICPRD